MTYLLDTNVVSEPKKPRPSRLVLSWLAGVPLGTGFVSVITLGEIRRGIEGLREQGAGHRVASLESWHAELTTQLGLSVIPVDAAIADRWGRLEAELRGHPISAADALIAATALANGWAVATRNVRHFARTGARVVNPFEG